MENLLKNEKSPYLRQHAGNPVFWRPWGEEALAEAASQNKLIFLSIGYSTCHWCHVMEHESFEDEAVAEALNRDFIAIKIDREERPDIDALYMDALQAMRGNGGWPLNLFLTPKREPFFGGTYFPKKHFLSVLAQIQNAWRSEPEKIASGAASVSAYLRAEENSRVGTLGPDSIQALQDSFARRFDPHFGGREGSPKFVPSYDLRVLLRLFHESGDARALEMVRISLDHIQRGGIYDHLGGGFHRYSTDERWLVPHFEKMLYDQAALAELFLEACQCTGDPEYAAVTREILDYVLREITDPSGGFYSAEDADTEGEEGKFYVWRKEELHTLLTREELAALEKDFPLTEGGNFEHGTEILHLAPGKGRVGRDPLLREALKKLLAARKKRARPGVDKKIIAAWNGLMIAVLAKAARSFQEPRYLRAAETAMDFCLTHLRLASGKLARRWIDGEAKHAAFDEDYAFLIHALIEIYQTSFASERLRQALELQQALDRQYADGAGGYFHATGEDRSLLRRGKNYHDNVVPSGNSIAALNLLRLGDLCADPSLRDQGLRLLAAFPEEARKIPMAFPQMLMALGYALGNAQQAAVIGDLQDPATRALLAPLQSGFHPHLVVAAGMSGDPALLKGREKTANEPTAYLCEQGACKLPTHDPEEIRRLLSS